MKEVSATFFGDLEVNGDYEDESKPVTTALKGFQNTAVTDNKFDVRFISGIDSLAFDSVGTEVTATYSEGNKSVLHNTTNVFTSLIGKGDDKKLVEVSAADLGVQYLYAVVIKNVPTGLGYITFTIKPYTVTGTEKSYGATFVVIYDTDGNYVTSY